MVTPGPESPRDVPHHEGVTIRAPRSPSAAGDREILALAVPAFFALVAEPLFLLVDSAIVGRLGTTSLAALGVASAVLAGVVGVCVFLAYATTGAVARRLGAGDLRSALTDGVDGLWLGLGLGVALAVATVIAAPALGNEATDIDTPDDLARWLGD